MKSDLTIRKIFIFWFPLALSWLMMSVEGPFVAAVIARLANAKYNLAAHGVAFSFALLVESPIINISSAATALCRDENSYLKLRNFVTGLNIAITAVMVILLTAPVFDGVMLTLIGLPRNIADLVHTALTIMLPWPAAIGFRRFYQGVLITRGMTRQVTFGTGVRLSTMMITAIFMYAIGSVGVYAGATALSLGVVGELIAVRLMAGPAIRDVCRIKADASFGQRGISYGYVARFYYPLGLMTLLGLGAQPMVTFFMGKSLFPVESLAVLPVLNALVFIFKSVALSYQEALIALLGDRREYYAVLKRYAVGLGITLVGGLSLVAFTPLSDIWFHQISGLEPALSAFAGTPAKILVLLPGLTMMIAFQWGVLVHAGRTTHISIATAVEVGTMLLVLFYLIGHQEIVGATAAAIAFVAGSTAGNLYLLPQLIRTLKAGQTEQEPGLV